MGNPTNKVLCTVASGVLEGLAFIFALPAERMEDIDVESLMAAKVSFHGRFSGILIVAVSREILPELAGNMVGMEMGGDVSEEQQQDALRELINVICGNLLPAIAGKQEMFDIEVPEVLESENIAGCTEGRTLTAAAKLELDEGYVNLRLYCEGELPVSG